MKPKPAEVRRTLPAESAEQSTVKAVAIFIPPFILYCATFAAIPFTANLTFKVILSISNAVLIAILFVVGHDACHGSFTAQRWLNNLLGRIAFLPSLHPFTSWELGHNRLHHCWTNLRGKDYVWTPLSYEEYRAMPLAKRTLEKFYRSPFGVGAYYFVEIWWKHMVFPRGSDVDKLPKGQSIFDRVSVFAFLSLQAAVLVFLAATFHTGTVSALLTGIVLPQALWNWLMGFVVFQHHTHPRVTWYDDPQEWSFFAGQVQGTVHVIFPWPIGFILHNIMEHTAHHIDPKIPLYNLPASQRAVQGAYSEHVIESRFTPKQLLRIMAACQLYDYRSHRWLDFSGKPTTDAPVSAV